MLKICNPLICFVFLPGKKHKTMEDLASLCHVCTLSENLFSYSLFKEDKVY